MDKEKKKKLLPIIIAVIVILLIIAITLGVVLGTKPKGTDTDKDKGDDTTTEDTTVVWEDWKVTAPSGANGGYVIRKNDKGEEERHELPVLSSDKYTKEVLVAPTYDADGKTKYSIVIDGVTHSFEVVTPKAKGNILIYVNGTKLDTAISHLKADTVTAAMVEALIGENYTSYAVYSDEAYANAISDINAYVKDKAETSLYVKKTLTYTLELNEGKLLPTESTSIATYEAVTLPTPTKEGNDFLGWFTTNTFDEGTKVDTSKKYYSDTNIKLYAAWQTLDFLYTPIYNTPGDEESGIKGYSIKENSANPLTGDVVIPATYKDKPVIEIGNSAFKYCELKSITIPNSVTTMGTSAFYGCEQLTTVTFAEGSKLATISNNSFGQSAIKSITIPNSVTTIDINAFNNCSSLTSFTFEANSKLTSIGKWAFDKCSSLTDILLPNSITTISERAFSCWTNSQTIYVNRAQQGMTLGTNWSSQANVIWGYNSKEHTYTFDAGADATVEPTAKTSAKAITLPTPTKEGYKFLGWDENQEDDGSPLYQAGTQYYNNNGATLYAKWELDKPILYTPILNDSGEEIAYSIKANPHNKPTGSITIENVYGLPVTTIVADGFKDCADVTDIIIPTSVTTIGANAFAGCAKVVIYTFHSTISEGWDNIYNPDKRPVILNYDGQEYTYNFVDTDGTHIKDISSTKAITLPEHTKTGYEFVGWCKGSASGQVFNAGTLFYNIGGDKFYAKWEEVSVLYDYDDITQTYTVKKNASKNPTGDLVIPATYNDGTNGEHPVAKIGDFSSSSITSVTIPSSVTTIGDNAFMNCSSLAEIILPSSITTIGNYAFGGWTNSQTIYVNRAQEGLNPGTDWSGNATVIWDADGQPHTYFFSVGADASVDPATTQTKGYVTLPTPTKTGYEFLGWDENQADDGSTLYQAGAKYYNKNNPTLYAKWQVLDFLYTPIYNTPGDEESGIKGYSIKENSANPAKGNIEIPATYKDKPVLEIGNTSFMGGKLTSITVPESVTTIGNAAFKNCRNLQSITFNGNSQLSTIGSIAFFNCSSLESIIISNRVTKIIGQPFGGCSKLTIYAEANEKPQGWHKDWNPDNRPVIWGYDGKEHTYMFEADNGTVLAPESLENIKTNKAIKLPTPKKEGYTFNGWYDNSTKLGTKYDGGAMYYNNKGAILYANFVSSVLTMAEIKDTVDTAKVIAYEVSSSKDVASVTIPATYNGLPVTKIGNSCFYQKANLQSVVFEPNSNITTLDDYCFKNTTNANFIRIELPKSLTTIGIDAFNGSAIQEVSFATDSALTTIGKKAFNNCKSLSGITIPSNVTSMGEDVFYGCEKLTSAQFLGTKLTTIPLNAFSGCKVLNNVVIPNGVTTIGNSAFYDNAALTNITIPDGVTTINIYAFRGCSALTEITLPSTIQTLGEGVFYLATNSLTIYVNRAQDGMSLGANWSGNANVVWNTPAVDTNIPEPTPDKLFIIEGAVVDIKDATGDIVIPSTFEGKPVNMIIEGLFLNKATIKSVLIPKSVEKIEANAFAGSTNLIIFAEAESKPGGWVSNWNSSNCPVIWGLEYTNKHTYMFDTMGGNQVDAIETNGLITLPDATKSGMVLDGWYENSNLTGTKYEAGKKYFNKNGATLYAKWITENVATPDKLTFTFCPASDKAPAHYSVRSKDDVTITGHVSIPEKYDDSVNGEYPVTEIEVEGFNAIEGSRLAHITSIYIPASIEIFPCVGIGHCLAWNTYLKKVVFADGCKVKKLGGSSFKNCTSLETVILHEGLTTITDDAFASCTNLKTVYIPSTVTTLGQFDTPAFSDYNPADTHFYIAATEPKPDWIENWHGGALPQNIHYGASKPAV